MVLWVSLSGTLSGTLRIVFQSHLVLCASMRIIVRNNFSFCFLHYFSNFFSKFWYFIIVINPIFLANSKNSLTPWMRSKLPEIYEHFDRTIFLMWCHLIYKLYLLSSMREDFQLSSANVTLNEPLNVPFNADLNEIPTWRGLLWLRILVTNVEKILKYQRHLRHEHQNANHVGAYVCCSRINT